VRHEMQHAAVMNVIRSFRRIAEHVRQREREIKQWRFLVFYSVKSRGPRGRLTTGFFMQY
jgi:hypothetical protein